jgi:hypothetical protein
MLWRGIPQVFATALTPSLKNVILVRQIAILKWGKRQGVFLSKYQRAIELQLGKAEGRSSCRHCEMPLSPHLSKPHFAIVLRQ